MTSERLEVERTIAADPASIFELLSDPHGHVAIDSSGMLMDATGEAVTAVGDSFVVHMDREALNDYPMGRYDVTVTITALVPDRQIEWTILGELRPQIGHVYGYLLEPNQEGTSVTSYYDWSSIDPAYRDAGIFPVISEGALRATLGILARTMAKAGAARRSEADGRGGQSGPVAGEPGCSRSMATRSISETLSLVRTRPRSRRSSSAQSLNISLRTRRRSRSTARMMRRPSDVSARVDERPSAGSGRRWTNPPATSVVTCRVTVEASRWSVSASALVRIGPRRSSVRRAK